MDWLTEIRQRMAAMMAPPSWDLAQSAAKGRGFIAIDVETANQERRSICQIGMVRWCDGAVVESASTLVHPREAFTAHNIRIHGIRPADVHGAPDFRQCADWLYHWLDGEQVISHTLFDHGAVHDAAAWANLAAPNPAEWLDSIPIVRRAWPDFDSYALARLARRFGITYQAHDALADATTCAMIVDRARKATPPPAASVPKTQTQTTPRPKPKPKQSDVNLSSYLAARADALTGEVIVFTGNFALPKASMKDLAVKAGATVGKGVTRKTTILVTGTRDAQAGWAEKSQKEQKADEYIARGQPIRIIDEAAFVALIRPAD